MLRRLAAGVELLRSELREAGARRPLDVFVELGHEHGRTGCRNPGEAAEIAELVRRSGVLRLVGVAGYEGTIAHDRTPDTLGRVRAFLDKVRGFAGD